MAIGWAKNEEPAFIDIYSQIDKAIMLYIALELLLPANIHFIALKMERQFPK